MLVSKTSHIRHQCQGPRTLQQRSCTTGDDNIERRTIIPGRRCSAGSASPIHLPCPVSQSVSRHSHMRILWRTLPILIDDRVTSWARSLTLELWRSGMMHALCGQRCRLIIIIATLATPQCYWKTTKYCYVLDNNKQNLLWRHFFFRRDTRLHLSDLTSEIFH